MPESVANRHPVGARRGRRSRVEIARIQEVLARFMVAGYSTREMQEGLLHLRDKDGNEVPVVLSERQIQRHISGIREAFLAQHKGAERVLADSLMQVSGVISESARGAAAHRGTNLELGYNNARLAGVREMQRLTGMDVRRLEVAGPGGQPLIPPEESPLDQMSGEEQVRDLEIALEEARRAVCTPWQPCREACRAAFEAGSVPTSCDRYQRWLTAIDQQVAEHPAWSRPSGWRPREERERRTQGSKEAADQAEEGKAS